jgi:hypothetical protein
VNASYRAKRHTSAGQKALALGLASATCVGLVGVIAVRNAKEASAQDSIGAIEPASATTSTGVTQAQLDQYAAQLAAEQQRLETYRQQLVATANSLATQSRSGVTITKPKRVPKKPVAKNNTEDSPSDTAESNTYVAPQQQAPTVQAPAPKQFAPAPAPQSNGWSSGGSAAAPGPAAKTRASKG